MLLSEYSESIWKSKYQYKNESFKDFCYRIASNVFSDDIDKQKELIKTLMEFKSAFGGRVNANIGIDEKGLTLFNCFILALSVNSDSLEGILDLAKRYSVTLKSEGGVGFCANFLRPRNTIIRKIGVTSPGSIKFLELYDKLSEIITSGSVDKETAHQGEPTKKSIRKGATMVTMSISHPDIEEFITAKSIPNRLTKMNMSVLITDAFMYAVEKDLDWDLWFPDINFELYESEWDGDFEKWAEKGYPTVIYKTVKAKYLWDLLLRSTYNRNEPGILFIDNIRKFDNLGYLSSTILATNPCGEVPGNTGTLIYNGEEILLGDVCNLGSINVTQFYDVENKVFDFNGFCDTAQLMLEALDNLIEVSRYPLKEYELAAKMKRKVGVGLTGIGSLMMMMNIRYGSDECLKFLHKLGKKFINALYRKSALLAKEKGAFELYSEELLNYGYVKYGELDDETIHLIKKHGLRNSAVASIAPNGTLSILVGNVSGGIEPVFAPEYARWNRIEGRKADFKYPDVSKGEWYETDYFKFDKSGDEEILISEDGRFRIDKNTGLCEKVIIRDYGYNIALSYGFENVFSATELSIEEHLSVLAVLSKYVDLSISKTINLPATTSFEEFKSLYGNIHKLGLKGCTTYREGSTVAVLQSVKKEEKKRIAEQSKEFIDAFKDQKDNGVVKNVKLPDKYPAFGYILRSEGKKWYVHVAFKDKGLTKPFAIFVNTNSREDNVSTFNTLEKLEELALAKGLPEELITEVKNKYAYQKNPVKICRMLGFLLRHNVDINQIVKAMDLVDGAGPGTFVFRMKKFLAQFITEEGDPILCPNCNTKGLVFQEGCYLCKNCGFTKC